MPLISTYLFCRAAGNVGADHFLLAPSPRPIPSPAGGLGYIIAPPEIIDRAKKVHDFLTVGAAAPLQEAVIPGLKFGQEYYDDLLAKYTHKKELFLKGLDDLHIVHNDPEGAYYVLLDISEFGYDSDLKFCEDLARLVGVGAVPGSSFFREPVNHLIRFHFAKKDETLLNALNRLESLRSKTPTPAKGTERDRSQAGSLTRAGPICQPHCERSTLSEITLQVQGFCWIFVSSIAPIIPRIGFYGLEYKVFYYSVHIS